jgi:hypothetical protein
MRVAAALAVVVSLASGCAHRASAPVAPATGGSGNAGFSRKYIDTQLGFEVERPFGNWQLDANDVATPEGVSVPVILRNSDSGAQVVVQIAPAVATPTQFAERVSSGLRAHPGFIAGEPEPLRLCDGAVGFEFQMGNKVAGKVAVREGGPRQVFMMMATWPVGATGAVGDVDRIFLSVKPLTPVARR